MLLIVITHSEFFAGEGEVLNRLFEAGLTHCHLRKPMGTETELRHLLDAIQPAYYDRIALHQHHQLAKAYGLRRLHFTEHARTTTEASVFTEWRYTLSTSVHSLSTARQLPPVFSYAFFSPVFNSISKPGYHAVIDSAFYWPAEKKAVPMIALGGIDASNIEKVKQMNFDGAALMGLLWKEPGQAVELFKNTRQICSQLVHT